MEKYNSSVLGPSPYTLVAPSFALRSLAQAAGRAALGGPRESILAALVAARLTRGALPGSGLTPAQRSTRADHARNWLGTIALPPVPKVAATRVIELSAKDDLEALAAALAKVTDVTAPYLDRAARLELDSLAAQLRE
jgi:hypothetical protein